MPNPFPTVRDPILSLYQSAAAAVAHRLRGEGPEAPAHPLPQAAAHVVVRNAPSDARHTLPPPAPHALTCAQLGLDLLHAAIAGDAPRRRALQDRLSFSSCDPLWAETLLRYARLYLPDGAPPPIPYIRHAADSDFVETAPGAQLRVALISDWGTGTETARQVAAMLARQAPDVVIHLGDIYFSGTAEECTRHFLAPLRTVLPGARLFTLCGNHDVYSGGQGYYDLLSQIGQPASYFCLRSPDSSWQILAADTGLHDRNPFDETAALTWLEPAEEAWHADKLRGFPGRTLFLTHHPPFSGFRQIGPLAEHSAVNPNLMASHARLAAAGHIDGWFWGHEHRLHLYAPYRGVAAGRNIGFGAIPVDAPESPVANLADPPTAAVELSLDVIDGAYTHGFVMLDLAPETIEATYWALSRQAHPLHREVWAAGTEV